MAWLIAAEILGHPVPASVQADPQPFLLFRAEATRTRSDDLAQDSSR
jgi:hypothetical protein